tara:strand:- start:1189 stop:1956 length:768 start_codon:yes stop_codon:yes gene_type:complete
MDLYLMLNGTQVGPYKVDVIKNWVSSGFITIDYYAWYEGATEWLPLKQIPEFEQSVKLKENEVQLFPPFDAYSGNEPYIFISYAHRDSASVFNEISFLNDAGYKIWYDEGIEASNEWSEEIAKALINSSVFLVYISPQSTSSINCRNEINLALNENKPFLAVHIQESTLPPGLRLRMGDLQAIFSHKLPENRYQKKICDTLNLLLRKEGDVQTLTNASQDLPSDAISGNENLSSPPPLPPPPSSPNPPPSNTGLL